MGEKSTVILMNENSTVLEFGELVAELVNRGGMIVSSSVCTAAEIAEARADNRFAALEDGLGFVLRPFPKKRLKEIEIYRRRDGDIGVRLIANNNLKIAGTEGYKKEADARGAIELIRSSPFAPVVVKI